MSVFKEEWIFNHKFQMIVTLPQGGNIGRFIYKHLGFDSFLVGHRYFYAKHEVPGYSIIMNTDNLGTWRLKLEDAFESPWKSHEEMKNMMSTLSKLQEYLTNIGVTSHFLGGKSLLGYARNRTLLAWEDAVSIMVDEKDHPRVLKALNSPTLKQIGLMFAYFSRENKHGLKVFQVGSPLIPRTAFAFVSVDIVFYQSFGDKSITFKPILITQEYSSGKLPVHSFPRADVFPTKRVSMDGVPVYIPRNPLNVAKNLFGWTFLTSCQSRKWDRRWEQWAGGEIMTIYKSDISSDHDVL